MSSEKDQEFLKQLQEQHATFCAQRDQAQINFQQLVGAIFACENTIEKYKSILKKDIEKPSKEGEVDNGKIKKAS